MAGRLAWAWWAAAVLWPARLARLALLEVPGRAASAVLVALGARRVLRALLALLGDGCEPSSGRPSSGEFRRLLAELDRAREEARALDAELRKRDRQRWRLAAALEQQAEDLAELRAAAASGEGKAGAGDEGGGEGCEGCALGERGAQPAGAPTETPPRPPAAFWPLHLAVLLAAALFCRAAERLPSVERKLVLCIALPLGYAYVGVLRGRVFRESSKMLVCALGGFALGLMALSDLRADAAAAVTAVGSLRPPA